MNNLPFFKTVMEHDQTMKAFAYNLTREHENAADLVQETLFKALKNQDKFLEGTNLKAWLLTIMKNIFINNYRKAAKQYTINDISDNLFILNSGPIAIENEAESSFIMNDLTAAVQQLNIEYRRPFIMHYHGFKYDEIAEELNLPLGTVKSRIFFARKQMQDFLRKRGFQRF